MDLIKRVSLIAQLIRMAVRLEINTNNCQHLQCLAHEIGELYKLCNSQRATVDGCTDECMDPIITCNQPKSCCEEVNDGAPAECSSQMTIIEDDADLCEEPSDHEDPNTPFYMKEKYLNEMVIADKARKKAQYEDGMESKDDEVTSSDETQNLDCGYDDTGCEWDYYLDSVNYDQQQYRMYSDTEDDCYQQQYEQDSEYQDFNAGHQYKSPYDYMPAHLNPDSTYIQESDYVEDYRPIQKQGTTRSNYQCDRIERSMGDSYYANEGTYEEEESYEDCRPANQMTYEQHNQTYYRGCDQMAQ